jgi:uncharacterized membrane protein YeaQ/YmgE (transglycosylase-associated protein family)
MIGTICQEGPMLTADLLHLPLSPTIPMGNIALDPGGILKWILAGLLAGWLAGLVVRGRGFGCLGDILLGLVGAFIGAFILGLLPVPISGVFGFFETLVVAFLGALLLAAIGRMIGGARHSARYTRYTHYEWPNRTYEDR